MQIYNSFKKIQNDDCIEFHIKDGMWETVKQYLSKNAIECYLKDDEIVRFQKISQEDKVSYLTEHIIPTKGSIKSGDFGEILTYYFLTDEYNIKNVKITGPKKWKWKDDKNKAAPGADVLLYKIHNIDKPDPKDLILSAESKMCATRPRSEKNRIQEAIDGSTKDSISRLASTINWLYTKYTRNNDLDSAVKIDRFRNPVDYPYRKKFYAIAIFDESLLSDELAKGYIKSDEIHLYILSIKNLRELYENFFEDAVNGC